MQDTVIQHPTTVATTAKSKRLRLDAAIVTREVGFYALSIALLLYALRDKEPVDDDQLGVEHIFISFTDAALLASGYILYVIVCAYFDPIVDFCSKRRASRRGFGADYGTINRSKKGSFHMPEDMAYAHRTFHREPSSNFDHQESFLSTEDLDASIRSPGSSIRSRGFFSKGSFLARTLHLRSSSHSAISSVGSFRLFNVQVQAEKPSDHYPLYDIQANAVSVKLDCCPERHCVSSLILWNSASLRRP